MRLLEHQGKKLLAAFGLAFTAGSVVESPEAARAAAVGLGGAAVLKAQVPFGGRGKAGAVKFARTPDEAFAAAGKILSLVIRGQAVRQVSVEPRIEIRRELYAGVTWDVSARMPVAIVSDAGGVEVERAESKITRQFDPWKGLAAYEGREMAAALGLEGKLVGEMGLVLAGLSRAFLECDAFVMEINPLAETAAGGLLGLDAHVELDDDAGFRQRSRLESLGVQDSPTVGDRPPTALELEARRIDASDHRGVAGRVVEFDGDLGLIIGGGGASLTVFDAIRRYGGKPANYCEIGGNPTEEKVAALTALLLSKSGVEQLAVIMNVVNNTRADVVARGVVTGIKRAGRTPAETIKVFRVPGSWEQEARAFLAAEGIRAFGREMSLDQAAMHALKAATAHVA